MMAEQCIVRRKAKRSHLDLKAGSREHTGNNMSPLESQAYYQWHIFSNKAAPLNSSQAVLPNRANVSKQKSMGTMFILSHYSFIFSTSLCCHCLFVSFHSSLIIYSCSECVDVSRSRHVLWCTCKSQRRTCESWFFSFYHVSIEDWTVVGHVRPCYSTDIRTGKAEGAQTLRISETWEQQRWSHFLLVWNR